MALRDDPSSPAEEAPDRCDIPQLDRLATALNDRLLADAGLLLPATLTHHLGLRELVGRHLDLDDRPGWAHSGWSHGSRSLMGEEDEAT